MKTAYLVQTVFSSLSSFETRRVKEQMQKRHGLPVITEYCLFYIRVFLFTLFKADQPSSNPQNSGMEVVVVFARKGQASSSFH